MLGLWKNPTVMAAKQGNAFVVKRDGQHLLGTSSSPAVREAAHTLGTVQINPKQ